VLKTLKGVTADAASAEWFVELITHDHGEGQSKLTPSSSGHAWSRWRLSRGVAVVILDSGHPGYDVTSAAAGARAGTTS
jgi:hypothetical protein